MEWMAPWAAGIAAAISIPTLVLMYFLKLKRQEVLISSTLLWKRAVQDLQVNAPFQRLRRNLLLLLQLLALAAALLALGGPILSMRAGAGKRYVLLIDRSASMNATDAPGGKSRLAEAQRQAATLIDSLRGPSLLRLDQRGDEAMVIAFDGHAKVMCNFTADKAQLLKALEAVEPTDGASCLAEAIAVGRAFAQSAGEEENSRSAAEAAQLELFSDGRISDLAKITVGLEELRFHCLGSTSDNVAVTAMQARRSYERADEVHVFATLVNYGKEPAACDVQLSVSGSVRAVRKVEIPPAIPAAGDQPEKLGKVSITFVMTHSGSGIVSVRQLRADALADDDAAWTILPPPKKLTALLVTDQNAALEMALEACPLAKLDRATPAELDKMVADGAAPPYDVILLDRHAPAKLPRGRYVVFGPPPPDIGVTVRGELARPILVDWRDRHPVLQFVKLDNLFATRAAAMTLPRDAAVLAEFSEAPAMALVRRRGSTFLLVGFDVLETNWPFEAGFVMFCYNATVFLGMDTGRERQWDLKVGEAIALRADGQETATLTAPDGRIEKLKADPSGTFRCPGTHRVGIYRVDVPDRDSARYAVSILDETESHVAPSKQIVLSTGAVQAQKTEPRRTNRELWPYLALVALVVVCVEWLVYNSKVRL